MYFYMKIWNLVVSFGKDRKGVERRRKGGAVEEEHRKVTDRRKKEPQGEGDKDRKGEM